MMIGPSNNGLRRTARPVFFALATALTTGLAAGLAGCGDKSDEGYVRGPEAPTEQAPTAEPAETQVAPPRTAPDPASLKPASEADREEIETVFQMFGTALQEDDTDLAMLVLSKESIDLGGRVLLGMAMHMPEQLLLREPFWVRMNVLLLRTNLTYEQVKAVEGDAQAGMRLIIGQDGSLSYGPLPRIKLGQIFIEDGKVAHAESIFEGKTQASGYRFVLEEDGWKIDLGRVLYATSIGWEIRFTGTGNVNGGLTDFIRPLADRFDTVRNFWAPMENEDGTPAETTGEYLVIQKREQDKKDAEEAEQNAGDPFVGPQAPGQTPEPEPEPEPEQDPG